MDWSEKVKILIDTLPFLRRFSGKTVVVKYGGHAMGDPELARQFALDIVLLKQIGLNPVVVHGGGPQIGAMLERLRIKSEFIDGLRVTDQATVEIVEMVLAGSINKQIVGWINDAGGKAVGISGRDANLITARPLTRTKIDPDSNIERLLDLGFVGEPESVNPEIIFALEKSAIIPVIAPTGSGPDGKTYNINADTSAGAIAAAVKAERLLMLTDVAGVLDEKKNLIHSLTATEARGLIASGVIHGGMIPKIENCLFAVDRGVGGAVILDGRVAHALLIELFTSGGAGTLVRA